MKKIIITALLRCIGFIVTDCKDKIYSVENLKKDPKLLDEWYLKCAKAGPSVQASQNCKNVLQTSRGL
ncbi:EexN family lipoprotein [Bartonella sp. 220]|uniref:EexN family lipoprotein n=1 Tax=Bartonella sp. 220B TaxID=2967260 RepID=UPI0022A8FD88|nr:EexN family lipoprotein [Bartonella sp. 220B]MCZ2158918.1 EexN family lipoprotein [Bartonella sp. 220B]